MPDQHAKVSASGFFQWSNCTPSVAMQAPFEDTGSDAAKEGTEAHALAEKKLKSWKKTGRRTRIKHENEEMQEATDGYRDYVIEIFNQLDAKGQSPVLDIEVREDLSEWIPEGFGTSDAVISSFEELHVIDLKYGKGVQVDAPGNGQLRLYALGAIAKYWDLLEFDTVTMHIYQPRLDHISTETMTVKNLRDWGETIKPVAKQAFNGEGETRVGEWCRFCRAACVCSKRAQEMFQPFEDHLETEAKQNDTEKNLLTVQELIQKYPPDLLDQMEKWAKDLKDFYLAKAVSGEDLPGYKLIVGRSNRVITDPDGIVDTLKNLGYSEDEIWKPRELKTLTALEKLCGKKTFAEECKDYIEKPPGKPKLAAESAKGTLWVPETKTPEQMFGPANAENTEKKEEE